MYVFKIERLWVAGSLVGRLRLAVASVVCSPWLNGGALVEDWPGLSQPREHERPPNPTSNVSVLPLLDDVAPVRASSTIVAVGSYGSPMARLPPPTAGGHVFTRGILNWPFQNSGGTLLDVPLGGEASAEGTPRRLTSNCVAVEQSLPSRPHWSLRETAIEVKLMAVTISAATRRARGTANVCGRGTSP